MLQVIVFIALIISMSIHKIITAFGYFKTSYDFLTSYSLGMIQFFSIVFLGLLSYGLLKRKAYARWGSILFFLILLLIYNVLVVILGSGPVNITKFLIMNVIPLFFIYQLLFGDSIKQFFRLKSSRVVVKKRLKNNMIFYDN